MQKIISFLSDSWALQIQTRLYAVPILLGLGIALYFIWPHEPGLTRPLLGTAFLAATAWWLSGLGDGSWRYLTILALMWIVAGFTAAKMRAEYVYAPMITAPMGPTGIEGHIASLEQLEGGVGVRIIIDDLMIEGVPTTETPKALRLSIRKGGNDLAIGNYIRVFAKIEPASRPTTPGGFDFRRHAYFKQIGGYGYVLGAPRVIQAQAESQKNIFSFFENARNHISGLVNATLEPRQAGMVAALLTGERAAINPEDWQALRDSGLAHLLAISGANVDMVAVFVFFLVRLALAAFPAVALRYPIKKFAAVAAFFAALFYVLLIYPSTPTLRALLTVTIVLLAILLDRSPITLRLVCVTASLILLTQPEQLLSPSFQLSFAAVTALVAVFEWVAPWLKRVHRDAALVTRLVIYLLGVCATTAIATVATAPISLYHFQSLALYGVVANVVAVPIMTFLIMPLAILCYAMIPLGVAVPSLHVLGAMCDWILDIAHAVAEMPGARWTPPAMPLLAFLMIVLAGLVLCLAARRLKAFALVPVMAGLIILTTHEWPHAVVLADGKVVMRRLENGEIVTNTRRYARRIQNDWVRYWGGDDTKGARVDKSLITPSGDMPITDAPVAVYPDGRTQVIAPRVKGRLWD